MRFDIDGIIRRPGLPAPVACIVRDISETGARLQFESSTFIPSEFQLDLEHEGFSAKCSVVWWARGEVGVAFNPGLIE